MSDGAPEWFDHGHEQRGGAGFAALTAARRRVDDALAGAAPPPELMQDMTDALTRFADALDAHQVGEHYRFDGLRADLPGRGHLFLPPFVVDERSADGTRMRGRVTFGRVHLGGGAAVHGGVQPLLFDDVLGLVANTREAFVARTAYLKVDYRALTPLDVELRWDASLDRVDGRKRFTTGRLTTADGTLLCEAEALYVELRRS